jgi:hypothetical protein
MTYTAANGPLGLQGRHTWYATGVDGFTLNDLEYGLPVAQLDRITGLFALPDFTDLRDPVIGGNGEVIYPSYSTGKTITYEGRIITADGESLYAYRWEMLNTFGDRTDPEGTMNITPHPSWGSGGWKYTARVLALEIDDEYLETSLDVQPSPYQLHFILSVRSKDGVMTQT